MIIADRGFCDLYTLAEKKVMLFSDGTFARNFYKYGSRGRQANNSFSYLKSHSGFTYGEHRTALLHSWFTGNSACSRIQQQTCSLPEVTLAE